MQNKEFKKALENKQVLELVGDEGPIKIAVLDLDRCLGEKLLKSQENVRQIFRKSGTMPGWIACTYYNKEGGISHSVFDPAQPNSDGYQQIYNFIREDTHELSFPVRNGNLSKVSNYFTKNDNKTDEEDTLLSFSCN